MKRLTLLCALTLLLAACGSPKLAHENKNAPYYFQQGQKYYNEGHYKDAEKAWEKVRDLFYSPELTARAEMKIADAHYADKEYVEAAAGYEDFLKQHPENELTPKVLFKLGMSYYKQILSADRDQTATHDALATFESLQKIYPDSPNIPQARKLVQECKNRLAAHQFYVGNFYLRTGDYQAAIGRLTALLTTYPKFPHQDRTYCDLVRAYVKAGHRSQAEKTFRAFSKQYPKSKYLPEAESALKDTHSWWDWF